MSPVANCLNSPVASRGRGNFRLGSNSFRLPLVTIELALKIVLKPPADLRRPLHDDEARTL